MNNTLGIDCPKNYLFNNSCVSTGTPRRLSRDFDEGLVGDIVEQPRKKIKLNDPDDSFGPVLRSHSTPRRSARIRKASSAKPISTVGPSGKTAIKPRVLKKPPAEILPKPNRTLELRKQSALKRGAKPKTSSNAIVMKPHFQKPKLAHTVPKTPELIRRLRGQRKRPNPHKSFADKEKEEVEAMKKYKFKAAPVPKAVKKPSSLPNRVKSEKPTTKPVTPKLSKGKKRKLTEEKPKEFKAQPVPNFGKKASNAKINKKSVEIKPFSFDQRYVDPNQSRAKLLENHLKELKEKTVFKANPYFKPGPSASKENKNPTKSTTQKRKKFELPGEAISRRKKEAFQKKVQEDAEKQKALANFRASSIRSRR